MECHERPCKLVPSLGTKGYGLHDRCLWIVGVRVLIRNGKFLGVVVCCCDKNAWNRIGSCCEGTVKCPVEWS